MKCDFINCKKEAESCGCFCYENGNHVDFCLCHTHMKNIDTWKLDENNTESLDLSIRRYKDMIKILQEQKIKKLTQQTRKEILKDIKKLNPKYCFGEWNTVVIDMKQFNEFLEKIQKLVEE